MAKRESDTLRRMRDLGKLLEDEELRFLAVKKLKSLLNCKKVIILREGDTMEVDDNHVQALATQIILNYTDGPPSKRITIVHTTDETISEEERAELLARVMGLPSGRGTELLQKKIGAVNGNGASHA